MRISPMNCYSLKTNNMSQKSNNPNFGKLIIKYESFNEDSFREKFLSGILGNPELKKFVAYFHQYRLDVKMSLCVPAVEGYHFEIVDRQGNYQMHYWYNFAEKAKDIIEKLRTANVRWPSNVRREGGQGYVDACNVRWCDVPGSEFLKNFNCEEAKKDIEERQGDRMHNLCNKYHHIAENFDAELRRFNNFSDFF